MTTIAWKGDILAADSQITQDDVAYLSTDKICVINKDLLLACAGDINDITKLERWFRTHQDWEKHLDKKPTIRRSLDAILLSKGKPYTIFKDGYPDPLGHPFFACGSGWKFAMAGMHMGLPAYDAVKLAAEFDVNTNNIIRYINVRELAESSGTKSPSKRRTRTTPKSTTVPPTEEGARDQRTETAREGGSVENVNSGQG